MRVRHEDYMYHPSLFLTLCQMNNKLRFTLLGHIRWADICSRDKWARKSALIPASEFVASKQNVKAATHPQGMRIQLASKNISHWIHQVELNHRKYLLYWQRTFFTCTEKKTVNTEKWRQWSIEAIVTDRLHNWQTWAGFNSGEINTLMMRNWKLNSCRLGFRGIFFSFQVLPFTSGEISLARISAVKL